jgi:N-methylhydantoinase A/oxoprolinase/acetone carboxylase beta subunit
VSDLRLGIAIDSSTVDVAVLDPRDRIVAKATAATGPDARAGMLAALGQVTNTVEAARVGAVMLASGHAIGAASVPPAFRQIAVIRIGSPLTLAIPPLGLWPSELHRAVSAGEVVVEGGTEYDGRTLTPLDGDAIAGFLATVAGTVEGVAITAVFSTVDPEHELAAAQIVRRELGRGIHVSLSHEIGTLGLLERENATVVNAALAAPAGDLARAVAEVLADEGIDGELFLGANDGSLMALGYALRFPVLLIGSAAAAGIRGAAHLSGVSEAVVVRSGATSTEIGVLVHGSPSESTMPLEVAGVRMSFRMPEVGTLPFGLTEDTRGDAGQALAGAVARVTAARGSLPLLAIGSAGTCVPDGLQGVGEVIRPPDADVAGAVGIAIAPVSGRADRICRNQPEARRQAVEDARAAAVARAVAAGADPGTVEIAEVEEGLLTYLVDRLIHIRVKAIGARA